MWLSGAYWIWLRCEDLCSFCFYITRWWFCQKIVNRLMRLRYLLPNLKIVSHCVTYWHSLDKIKMRRPLESFVSFKMMIERTDKEGKGGPSFTIVGWFLPGVIHSDRFCRILLGKLDFLTSKLVKCYWITDGFFCCQKKYFCELEHVLFRCLN